MAVFGFGVYLVMLIYCTPAYALNIDKVKAGYLSGDYKAAIIEGEKILAGASHDPEADELYYFLGLSYLKDGNYLRASDIFEIIKDEFKSSRFKDEAGMGLADVLFLKGDYDKAQEHYSALLRNSGAKLKAPLYYRLSQTALKRGQTQAAKEYLDKLKDDFPSSPEVKLEKDLYALSDIYYTVQVGSFASYANASTLRDKLKAKGYDAYLEETSVNNSAKIHRVRIGKLQSRKEAEGLEERLSSEGYPTKVFP
ncbi:MAG: SPOR domain-containing protein [Candidatus Omnitrophica bacterium]|nr:SPOR domain-containing protein [Candidatus Omnitrophota bacterium]